MARILISAGGTGGGVYPALAVVSALKKQDPNVTIDFATSVSGVENKLLDSGREHIDHWHKVQSGPMHGVNPIQVLTSAAKITLGFFQSIRLLRRTKPNAIFLTGGWVGVPVAVAARLLGIPVVIFVPDIEPGRTLKLLGRFSRIITATTQETERFYPYHNNVVQTGYPLRESVLKATRDEGIEKFDLDADKRTLLVFGGSLGSRAINHAIMDGIDDLMRIQDVQLLHVTGRTTAEEMRQRWNKLPESFKARYHMYDYVDDFGKALMVADLVVSRAGASTMAELPIARTPGILIPLAYAWRYQEVNADWLVKHNAAIRLDEPNMDAQLIPLIESVLNNKDRLTSMHKGLESIARRDGADNIAKILLNFVQSTT